MSAIPCRKCQSPNLAGAKFCATCGGRLLEAQQFCRACGKLLEPAAHFCWSCGKAVAPAMTVAQAPADAPQESKPDPAEAERDRSFQAAPVNSATSAAVPPPFAVAATAQPLSPEPSQQPAPKFFAAEPSRQIEKNASGCLERRAPPVPALSPAPVAASGATSGLRSPGPMRQPTEADEPRPFWRRRDVIISAAIVAASLVMAAGMILFASLR